jgi:hypothetical protein
MELNSKGFITFDGKIYPDAKLTLKEDLISQRPSKKGCYTRRVETVCIIIVGNQVTTKKIHINRPLLKRLCKKYFVNEKKIIRILKAK